MRRVAVKFYRDFGFCGVAFAVMDQIHTPDQVIGPAVLWLISVIMIWLSHLLGADDE